MGNCNFSQKFLPLVQSKFEEFESRPEEFRAFLDENFNEKSADEVYKMFYTPVETPFGTIDVVTEKDFETGVEEDPVEIEEYHTKQTFVTTTSDSVDELFIGRPQDKEEMLQNFRREILSCSRLSIDWNNPSAPIKSVDATAKSGNTTVVNTNILKYKIRLINTILTEVGKPTVSYDENMTDEVFAKIVNDVLQTNIALSSEAYNAYVTLSKFDSLLKSEAPYVKIKREYMDGENNIEGIDKYEYVGASVQHFTGWTMSEFADSMDQASLLAKTVLECIPEIVNGRPVKGSQVGLSGFYSCMSAMRDCLMYHATDDMISIREELKKGDSANMYSVISAYIKFLKGFKEQSMDQYYKTHISYLLGKLEGIREYLFKSDSVKEGSFIDESLKSIFKQMFFKNVQMSYTGYTRDVTSSEIEGKDLKGSFINTQTYGALDTMAAAIYKFRTIHKAWDPIVNKWGIKLIAHGTFELKNGTVLSPTTHISNMDDKTIMELFQEVTGIILPSDFIEVYKQVQGDGYRNALLNSIYTVINSVEHNVDTENNFPSTLRQDHFKTVAPIGKVLSIVFGSNTANVVKNVTRKNNLPLFGLNSLAYNFPYIMWQHMDNTSSDNIYDNSYLFEKISTRPDTKVKKFDQHCLVLEPSVRSEVYFNGQLKSVDALTFTEVFKLAFVSDFFQKITDDTSESFALQNATFADKGTHFLINYRLDTKLIANGMSLREMIKSAMSGNSKPMIDLMYNTRRRRFLKLRRNICADYNVVFGKEFKTLAEIDAFLKNNPEINVAKAFAAYNDKINSDPNSSATPVNYYEEVHFSPKGGGFNETLLQNEIDMSSADAFVSRMNRERKMFIKDLIKSGFRLNKYTDESVSTISEKFDKSWTDEHGNIIFAKQNGKPIVLNKHNAEEILNMSGVELHPAFEAYFMSDAMLSNEYNDVMIGGAYCHPGKSESSRLIAQIKRSVIFGATQHSFTQNLPNGVAEEIKIAVMPDMPGSVRNIIGEQDDAFKSMDGAGLCTALQARLESNSLLDARAGYDKKTIGHDIDARYGRPTLLKWAVYAMTNARRRISYRSEASQEYLTKQCYSAGTITMTLDWLVDALSLQDVYFYDIEHTNLHYKIVGFKQNESGDFIRVIAQCDESGDIIGPEQEQNIGQITTLYDIDQAFGGAWCMSNVNGKLQYSETNVDALEKFVTDNQDAKNAQVAYLVNKSAIKVGAGNINEQSSWKGQTPFRTISMKTRYLGVQMDAEHHLEESEVTEMTQMISALSQGGYTSRLVNAIYEDIGRVVDESLAEYKSAEEQGNEAIYQLLGKAFIESFEQNDRDTIGLAQAFVMKASQYLKEGGITEYRIPFSADTVSGLFISTVSSAISKKGIRRKYDGFAGVLSPAFNQIQYFRIGNTACMFEEFAKLVHKKGIKGYDKKEVKQYAKYAHDGYEVSSSGDSRFSDSHATFANGTVIDGIDVGGKTIKWVYQNIIKTSSSESKLHVKNPSRSKTFKNFPKGVTRVEFLTDDVAPRIFFTRNGREYLFTYNTNTNLYDLALKSNDKYYSITSGTSGFPSVEQAFEIQDVARKEYIPTEFLELVQNYQNAITEEQQIEIEQKFRTDYGVYLINPEPGSERNLLNEHYFYNEGYLPLWKIWAKQNPELIEELRITSKGKVLTDQFADTFISSAKALAEILSESTHISAIDVAMTELVLEDGRMNPFLVPILQNEIDYEDTIVIRNPDGSFREPVYVKTHAEYTKLKHNSYPGCKFYNFTSKPKNLKDVDTKFVANGKTYSVQDLDSVRAAFLLQEQSDVILADTISDVAKTVKKSKGINSLFNPDVNGMHFGNPFSHEAGPGVQMIVPTVKDSVKAYEQWLRGTAYQEVEPERRAWIVKQIEDGSLKGKPIVYYKGSIPDDSYGVKEYDYETAPNHAHVLHKLIYEKDNQLINSVLGGQRVRVDSGEVTIIETHDKLLDDLGGDAIASSEIQDAVAIAKQGISFDEALSTVNPVFTPEEQAQIKKASGGKLFVKSVSRQTDPAFFSQEIIEFLKKNAELPFTDPNRVNVIEIWSKHDGQPIADILQACRKYKVAPMVSFSVTGLGGTALEQGVMKYQDMLQKIQELTVKGYLDPRTTTIRIDPILIGETNMDDIRAIVQAGKNIGIKKFVTSLVQSYGYLDGTDKDRKVTSGINAALAKEGRTYDWDKYYGRDARGKINFKPKQEYIDEIGTILLELDQDPSIKIETCSFSIKGLKWSACLDPMIIERITGVDVTSADGTYKRDTSRPECMCYGCHGDLFRRDEKTCFSSCAYCYAAHSGDSPFNYYDSNGKLIENEYTTIRPYISATSQSAPINIHFGSNDNPELSNFAIRPFEYNGVAYTSVEEAFQKAKLQYAAPITQQPVSVQEWANTSESSGKKNRVLGQSIAGLNTKDWDANSSRIMKELIKASFEQNPDALQSLLATGNAELTHTQEPGKWGMLFPKILMEVREELRPKQKNSSNSTHVPGTMRSESGMIYNPEQTTAIKGVSQIIKDTLANRRGGPRFVTIQGKAGTGKTTIINEILKQSGITPGSVKIEVSAVSHKAKNVLSQKIDSKYGVNAHSLAGTLGMNVVGFDENGAEIWKRKENPRTHVPVKAPVDSAQILFVDEASMLTEEQLKHIENAVAGKNVTVVFIGDIGQISPIRNKTIVQEFGVNPGDPSPIFTRSDIPVFELSTRVRQGEDSPVLAFADEYYEFNTGQTSEFPQVGTSSQDGRLIVQHGSVDLTSQLIDLFVEAKETLNPNKVKIVAAKNVTVAEYNRAIQKITNPQVTDDSIVRFGPGDLVIFNDNIYSGNTLIAANADEGQIVDVDPTIYQEDGIEYYVVIFEGEKGRVPVKVPVQTPENAKRYIAIHDALKAAASGFPVPEAARQAYDEFKNKFAAKVRNGTIMLNIALGYAITSDKSQGSTYEVVAVDIDDIMGVRGGWSDVEKAKRIYTGLTRGSNITIVKDSRSGNGTSPNVKEINDTINATKAAKTVEAEVTPSDISATLTGYVLHSGGADGADSIWSEIGEQYGVIAKHYMHPDQVNKRNRPPKGNTIISETDVTEGAVEIAKAAKRMFGAQYTSVSNLNLIRDWTQAKNADAIFAVGKLQPKGSKFADDGRILLVDSVVGGTGYAVNAGILHGKPVYVFNQESNEKFAIGWYKYDPKTDSYVSTPTPKLTQNFAGIGTRKINDVGIQAIKDVYLRSTQPDSEIQRTVIAPNYSYSTLSKAEKAKIIRSKIQNDLRSLSQGRAVMLGGQSVKASNVRVVPAEGISGRYHAKEFGLGSKDTVDKILRQGPKFFARKLNVKYKLQPLPDFCNSLIYSADGAKYLVAEMKSSEIDNFLANNPNVIVDKSFKDNDGVYYKGNQRVTGSDGVVFCTYKDDKGVIRKLIILDKKKKSVNSLMRSTFFDVVRKPGDDAEFEKWVYTRSWRMFKSFEEQLQTIGTRIPTQAMPSFMPMQIIAYTDSEVNDLYVPISLLQRQGADLDIDKEYMLNFGIRSNGTAYLHTKLIDHGGYSLEDLYRLDMPTGITYKVGSDEGSITITAEELKHGNWVDLINRCMKGSGQVNFVGTIEKNLDMIFMSHLNTHAMTELTERDRQEAVKNKVSMAIKTVTKSIENQIIAQISVDTSMKALGDIAGKSALANDEKTMTSDNPATKFIMQVQNMVGRQVIGVTAVSLKQFFAKTAYWNGYINNFAEVLRNSPDKIATVDEFISNLLKYNPVKDGDFPLANLNFLDLIDEVRRSEELNVKFGLPVYNIGDADFCGLPIIYGPIENRDGRPVGARSHKSGKVILVDLDAMKQKWETKAWQNPLRSSDVGLDFNSFEELMTWTLYHELGHIVMNHRGIIQDDIVPLENAANQYATERLLQIRSGNTAPQMFFNGRYCKDFVELLQNMQELADTVDASSLISALLSAATDNAKELILSKLNATTNLADIYTYLFSIGCSAEEIGEIMTSPEFSYVAKLADGDLFGTSRMSIDSAISLYLTNGLIKGIDPNLYNLAFGTYSAGTDVWTSNKATLEKLQSVTEIDSAIKFVIEQLNTTQRPVYDGDEFDEGRFVDFEEGAFGEGKPIRVRDFAKQKASRRELESLLHALFTHKDILIARAAFHKEGKVDMDDKLKMIWLEVLPGVEEQKILGAAAGINTGLKTKSFDKYKWARRIENYINRMFPYDPKNPDTYVNQIPFSFIDFLTNPEYQKEWIDKLEDVKIADNILKVITTVPHYKAMLDAWRLDMKMLYSVNRRFVFERELAEAIKPHRTYSISDLEWKQIQKFVNDTFIYNWIVSSGLSFEIPNGEDIQVYSATQELVTPADRVVKLDSPEGIASFKHIMETYVIPKLKEMYGNNSFIQALDLTAFEVKGVINSFFKLPLPMMDLDKSPTLEARYASYLSSFNDIVQDTFNGWKIGDLFYLYNLIVHKDSFGQRSMTRLFEDMATSSRSSLVNDFNKWLSEQDANPDVNSLSYDLNDLSYRIAEAVPGSGIQSDVSLKSKADFTFSFPSLLKVKELNEKSEKKTQKETVITSNAAKTSALFEILSHTPGVVLLTEGDYVSKEMQNIAEESGVDAQGLINIMQFAKTKKAFVYGGKIFINSWNADITDHLHEWTHIILANMKWHDNPKIRQAYYNMVSSIVKDPHFNEIAKHYRINGKDMLHGSDLQEEVFANLFQMYLQNKIFTDDTGFDLLIGMTKLEDNPFGKFTKQVLAGFVGNNPLLIEAMEAVTDDFGTDFIWQTHQKVSALKTKLVDDNDLTVKCE